jgi:flavin-dependent dehydrogenase
VTARLDADLLVVGGGPVGLMTATLAARAGLRTVVAEPREGVVDKACGEGLMPGAVAALHDVGAAVAGRPFVGIRYVEGTTVAEARFDDDGGHGLGVRRTALHSALLETAAASGAEVRTLRVDDLRQHADHVEASGVRARHVAAADGLASPVRALLGLDRPVRGPARFGLRRHHAVTPWTDHVEVHWSRHAEVYVTPVADDLVGVAVLGGRGVDVDAAVAASPLLAGHLAGAPQVGRTRGAGPLRRRSGARVAGRVLLVGDASGYVDALTGEGLTIGFAQAAAAVDAVLDGDLLRYERRWSEVTARYRRLTGALLQAQAHPVTRRAIVPAAARVPGLMQWCVGRLAAAPPR